jgi:hypothetical protein
MPSSLIKQNTIKNSKPQHSFINGSQNFLFKMHRKMCMYALFAVHVPLSVPYPFDWISE